MVWPLYVLILSNWSGPAPSLMRSPVPTIGRLINAAAPTATFKVSGESSVNVRPVRKEQCRSTEHADCGCSARRHVDVLVERHAGSDDKHPCVTQCPISVENDWLLQRRTGFKAKRAALAELNLSGRAGHPRAQRLRVGCPYHAAVGHAGHSVDVVRVGEDKRAETCLLEGLGSDNAGQYERSVLGADAYRHLPESDVQRQARRHILQAHHQDIARDLQRKAADDVVVADRDGVDRQIDKIIDGDEIRGSRKNQVVAA